MKYIEIPSEKIYIYFPVHFDNWYPKNSDTLPETIVAPENGWSEDDRFLLGCHFSELLVSGSVSGLKTTELRGILQSSIAPLL